MLTSLRLRRVGFVVVFGMLLMFTGVAPARGQATPCQELDALAKDFSAKDKAAFEDGEALATKKAAKPPAKPMGDESALSDAAKGYENWHAAEKALETWNSSKPGIRLKSVETDVTDLKAKIGGGEAAGNAARSNATADAGRNNLPDPVAEYNKINVELPQKILLQSSVKGTNKTADATLDADIKAMTARQAELKAKIFDATTQQMIADQVKAAKALPDKENELRDLKADQDTHAALLSSLAKAIETLKKYQKYGSEAEVQEQLTDLKAWDAQDGKLKGEIHAAQLQYDASKAAATAAQESLDKLTKQLDGKAHKESEIALKDANLEAVDAGLEAKNKYNAEWITEDFKNKVAEDQKLRPQLWVPEDKAEARAKRWRAFQARTIQQKYNETVEAEAKLIEATVRHLTLLPCMKEEIETADKIREKADFVRHLRRVDLAGENPFGAIPELTIPKVDSSSTGKGGGKAVAGTFGLVKKEIGKAAEPAGNQYGMYAGSESEGSFTFTYTGEPPYEAHATVTATYSSPPATLKPGETIELTCSVSANITGKDVGYIGMSAKWEADGACEVVEKQHAFGGYASDGKLYPSGKGAYKIKIKEGTSIKLYSGHSGVSWGYDGKWYPCYYTYEWNKAPTETPAGAGASDDPLAEGATTKPADDGESPVVKKGSDAVSGFSGKWDSDYTGLVLHQNSEFITGEYHDGEGSLEGTLADNVFTFKWREKGTNPLKGSGRFTFSRDGKSFKGHWTFEDDPDKGSPHQWNGKR